jgi:hypothetical protein
MKTTSRMQDPSDATDWTPHAAVWKKRKWHESQHAPHRDLQSSRDGRVFEKKKKKRGRETAEACFCLPLYEDEMDGINCPPMFAYTYLRGTRPPALRYPRLLI